MHQSKKKINYQKKYTNICIVLYFYYIFASCLTITTNIMETAIKNLEQTIKKIEWEILQCYDDNELPYLQRAKKESIICLTTLRYV